MSGEQGGSKDEDRVHLNPASPVAQKCPPPRSPTTPCYLSPTSSVIVHSPPTPQTCNSSSESSSTSPQKRQRREEREVSALSSK